MSTNSGEIARKLEVVRGALASNGAETAVFRGVDFFHWISGGRSNQVLLSAETGVAEICVNARAAWVRTNQIEARRMREELFVNTPFEVRVHPWVESAPKLEGRVVSDRPDAGEFELPQAIVLAKRVLCPEELVRYRELGADTARCLRLALASARPEWTELRLAAEAARHLWEQGIEPALILCAGESRLQKHRHPMPTHERLGARAFLVTCARRSGLFANCTRIRAFSRLSASERQSQEQLLRIESKILAACRVGATYASLWNVAEDSYGVEGKAQELANHHQGGPTGYLSREFVVSPSTNPGQPAVLANQAFAWNPSLAGIKIEDTVFLGDRGLEVLTQDAAWPTQDVQGIQRPLVWE